MGTLIATQVVGGEPEAVLVATLGVTVLLMVFGEIGSKTIALHHDWALARTYALPLTLPRAGERLRHRDLEITMVEVDARRVKSVAVRHVAPKSRRTE